MTWKVDLDVGSVSLLFSLLICDFDFINYEDASSNIDFGSYGESGFF